MCFTPAEGLVKLIVRVCEPQKRTMRQFPLVRSLHELTTEVAFGLGSTSNLCTRPEASE